MYKREMYLSRIRPFYDNEQIKILMGVRRCGKTEILRMVMDELVDRTSPDQITYLSFELLENRPLRKPEALYAFLEKLPEALKPGGRAAILTFHSGEDRLVKKSFKELERAGVYSEISRDMTRPGQEEIFRNPRAKSTKMRYCVKA